MCHFRYSVINKQHLTSCATFGCPSLYYILIITMIKFKALMEICTYLCKVRIMVFNTTFKYISAISWRSNLLVEETVVSGENHLQTCVVCLPDTNISLKIVLKLIYRGISDFIQFASLRNCEMLYNIFETVICTMHVLFNIFTIATTSS